MRCSAATLSYIIKLNYEWLSAQFTKHSQLAVAVPVAVQKFLGYPSYLSYAPPFCCTSLLSILRPSYLSYVPPICLTSLLSVASPSYLFYVPPFCCTSLLSVLRPSYRSYVPHICLTSLLSVASPSYLFYVPPFCCTALLSVVRPSYHIYGLLTRPSCQFYIPPIIFYPKVDTGFSFFVFYCIIISAKICFNVEMLWNRNFCYFRFFLKLERQKSEIKKLYFFQNFFR